MHRQLALLKWAETAAAAASDERSGEAQVTTTGLPQTMSTSVLTAELDKVQLIIDLMQKDQPFHDHNYTSILGRKKFIEVQKGLLSKQHHKAQDFTCFDVSTVY